MSREQTKTARRERPCVGNDNGGMVDVEERAHVQVEHASTEEGSAMDLGEGGAGDGEWVD